MSALGEYLKETRAELQHVAWPSQAQTIVYTILVALISLFVAAYLGVFDFLFTNALTKIIVTIPPQNPITISQSTATTTIATSTTSVATTTKQ